MRVMKRVTRWLAAFLVAVMVCGPAMSVSAAYPTKDWFNITTNIKGMQGAENNALYGGLDHTLCNVFLDDAIKEPDSLWATNGWIAPYEFEGEQFYFNTHPSGFWTVYKGNTMSVSVVFLLRMRTDEYGSDSTFLVDPGSRAGGYTYYAPNNDMSTYGGRAIRAYWHWLMERLESEGLHIDNFILGNEVNMPNQWHYSGSTNGTGDAVNCVTKYADTFYTMYSTIRMYSDVPRCSISLDHSWQNDNSGRGIAAKDFLHMFNDRLNLYASDVDWCVSTHLYPAQLFDTRIWYDPHNLAPNDTSARIIDGSNLWVMTNYIRDVFGSQHRVMLTEQGFTNQYGPEAQAACLAYTYYAAYYDPMVDCFLISTENAGYAASGESLNFDISGTLAEQVYTKICNGNAADQQWIANTCLPVIGVSSWEQIIPNFGQERELPPEPEPEPTEEEIAAVRAFVERMYTVALGRAAETDGLEFWSNGLLKHQTDGASLSSGFIISQEFVGKCYTDEEYVAVLYRTFFDREPDAEGAAYWISELERRVSRKQVLVGFVNSAEFEGICTSYGIDRGTLSAEVAIVPDGIYDFVERTYQYALGREGDEGGVGYWVQSIVEKMCAPEGAAKSFFLSGEYIQKGTSDEEFVEALYKTFMDREADADGMAYWVGNLQDGVSREVVLDGFAQSEEFRGIMAGYGL